MTRINLVEPHQLTDKHLMAEYRELPRIFTAVLKLQEQGKTPADVDIPERYVLGKGHVKFFYDKLRWLYFRVIKLRSELIDRGYELNHVQFHEMKHHWEDNIENHWFGNYQPKPEDIYLNMMRLCKRSRIASVLKELHYND